MASLTPAQTETLALLRGDPSKRPTVARELREELQATLDAELADVAGPLTVTKRKLSLVHDCEGRYLAKDDFTWSVAKARGTVAHKAIELSVGGREPVPPARLVDMAVRRVCEAPEHPSLAEYLRGIDQAEVAELRVAACDLVIAFFEMFPPLRDAWNPHAEATTAAWSGRRRITFTGRIDLKLGTVGGDRASTLVVDLKTGSPTFSDREDLRFYALLETLRTGVPPFRWANVYLAAGRTDHEDLSEGALWAALRRAVDGARKLAALEEGGAPAFSPGSSCRICPASGSCDAEAAQNASQVDWISSRRSNHSSAVIA